MDQEAECEVEIFRSSDCVRTVEQLLNTDNENVIESDDERGNPQSFVLSTMGLIALNAKELLWQNFGVSVITVQQACTLFLPHGVNAEDCSIVHYTCSARWFTRPPHLFPCVQYASDVTPISVAPLLPLVHAPCCLAGTPDAHLRPYLDLPLLV